MTSIISKIRSFLQPTLKYKLNHPDAKPPTRGSEMASGLDLYTVEDVFIGNGETVLVKTGVSFIIPYGYEVQIRPRSGVSLKTPLTVKNSPATIDQDYTGEVGIIVHNNFSEKGSVYKIEKGTKIAQAVLCPVAIPKLKKSDVTRKTKRGDNGYGSTGA